MSGKRGDSQWDLLEGEEHILETELMTVHSEYTVELYFKRVSFIVQRLQFQEDILGLGI